MDNQNPETDYTAAFNLKSYLPAKKAELNVIKHSCVFMMDIVWRIFWWSQLTFTNCYETKVSVSYFKIISLNGKT